jgi:hypothetical protein
MESGGTIIAIQKQRYGPPTKQTQIYVGYMLSRSPRPLNVTYLGYNCTPIGFVIKDEAIDRGPMPMSWFVDLFGFNEHGLGYDGVKAHFKVSL